MGAPLRRGSGYSHLHQGGNTGRIKCVSPRHLIVFARLFPNWCQIGPFRFNRLRRFSQLSRPFRTRRRNAHSLARRALTRALAGIGPFTVINGCDGGLFHVGRAARRTTIGVLNGHSETSNPRPRGEGMLAQQITPSGRARAKVVSWTNRLNRCRKRGVRPTGTNAA